MIRILCVVLLVISQSLFAANDPQAIPRRDTKHFVSEGLLKGGDPVLANLEGIRFASHEVGKGRLSYERWVLDFSDAATRTRSKITPRFLLRFDPPQSSADLTSPAERPGKFQILLHTIQNSFLRMEGLRRLTEKSRYIDKVLVYPILDDGDCAIEMILKPGVEIEFSAHQPESPAGKIVVDLRSRQ